MEEALLCLLLAADKVDVINQQHISLSIFIAEFLCFLLPNSIYKLVSKLFTANTNYLNMAGLSHMTNRLQ